jgi:DNA invertase Pin-like site-specific DNA recombinase
MIFGYARVSTQDQNLDRQLKQLKEAGVEAENILSEKITGTKKDRPELMRLYDKLRAGDVVIIADLTRISRSTKDLLEIVEKIKTKGASIKSIKDTWLDTTSDNPYNAFLLTVMSGLSQLERDLISTRTKEGLESARARGRVGGRKRKPENKIETAIKMHEAKIHTIAEITETTGISKPTLYRYINERRAKE